MRKLNSAMLVLSAALAVGQEPAASPKETPPTPAPQSPIQITPEMLPLLRPGWIVVLPVSGECVIPLKQMPIPDGTKYSGEKAAPGPGNVDKMPRAAGLPVCGAPQAK